jgi:hypothetical protein
VTTPLLTACISENLAVDAFGVLRMAPWSVPRVVVDVRADSGADGNLLREDKSADSKLLIDQVVSWHNDTPVAHMMRILITRRWKYWIVSNPNAVQYRDRWTTSIDSTIDEPVTASLYNGQTGSANDVGTNTVAEPNPGEYWHWWGTTASEEWKGPIDPGSKFGLWYRQYVWTPPPYSDNANKNKPVNWADAGWSRITLEIFPTPGKLVSG